MLLNKMQGEAIREERQPQKRGPDLTISNYTAFPVPHFPFCLCLHGGTEKPGVAVDQGLQAFLEPAAHDA